MDAFAPVPRGPRAVAGLPAVDADAIAKAWLLELLADAPLEAAAALPTAELVRHGPPLAAAVVEALGDDAALARLTADDELAARAPSLVGATDAVAVIAAVESLRRAVVATLLAAARLDAVTTAELVDRLAAVCTRVSATAVAGLGRPAQPRAPEPEDVSLPPQPVAPAPPAAAASPPAAAPPRRAPAPQRPAAAPPEPAPGFLTPEEPDDIVEVHRVDDPLEALRVRQSRQAEPLSWRQAVEWRIKRHEQDGSPFALLAVEVDNVQRLLAADEGEVGGLLGDLERALAAELRPADQLLRDEQGRYWVTAPDTGPTVARLLAERLAESAQNAASHRGVPLRVSIGVASCPEDGVDGDELADRADRGLFAARAAGTTVG